MARLMNYCKYSTYVCVMLSFISSGVVADPKLFPVGSVMGNADADISSDTLPLLEENALNGSPEAAMKLCDFFRYIKSDLELSYFWATIGAENGGADAQNTVGNMLLDSDCTPLRDILSSTFKDNASKFRRAMYWYRLAAKSGNKWAEWSLQKYKNGPPKKYCDL